MSVLVQFTDLSSTDVTSWLWYFGDGNTSTSQNPTNTYTADGSYLVTLRATGSSGTATFQRTLIISGDAVVPWTADGWGESPGGDPQVMLRLSNDGGKTWISEVWRSAGKVGEYLRRVRWNRLGVARRRVFEVSVTDPIPWRLVGAYLESEPGTEGKNA